VSPPPVEDETPWTALQKRITPDGVMPLQESLEAFSLAIAPLTTSDSAADPLSIESGTMPVLWIANQWSALTIDQQKAAIAAAPEIDQLVNDSGLASVRQDQNSRRVQLTVGYSSGARWQGDAERYFSTLLAKLSLSSPGWKPTVTTEPPGSSIAAKAVTFPTARGCNIVLSRHFGELSSQQAGFALAHEAFHCVQGVLYGAVPGQIKSMPAWEIEGGATWAGIAVSELSRDPNSTVPGKWWDQYLAHPGRTLFSRSYDAFAFFTYLQNRGINVWQKLSELRGVNATDFDDLVAAPGTIDNWSPGFFRTPDLGMIWDQDGMGITPTRPETTSTSRTIVEGSELTMENDPASTRQLLLDVQADIVEIATSAAGLVRLGDGTELPLQGGLMTLCNRDDQCECPEPGIASSRVTGILPPGEVRVAAAAATLPVLTSIVGKPFNCDQTAPAPTTVPALQDSACLGTWQMTRMEGNAPEVSTLSIVSAGAWTFITRPDGSAIFEQKDLAMRASGSNPGNPNWTFDQSYPDGRVEFSVNFDKSTHIAIFSGDGVSTENALSPPGENPTYTCSDSEMTLIWTNDGATLSWVWERS
jgi:hypothetical protein